MRSAIVALLVAAAMVAFSSGATADGWDRYDNPRFAYAIDIPPGFSDVSEAENGDGGASTSADGRAELKAWGAYLAGRDFRSDVADRVQSDSSEGWDISYDRRTATNASWSGSKDGRVFYARAMMGCDDAAIYFRLEYDRSQLKTYDPIIRRLVKSLHGTC